MEERKLELFFMGTDDAYVALDGGNDNHCLGTLHIANARYSDGKRNWESMVPFNKDELKERLSAADIIFLNGRFEDHLKKIEAEDCLELIKNKPIVIMAKQPKDVSAFQLTNVKFIPSTRKAFEDEIGIVREASPQKKAPPRINPLIAVYAAEEKKLRLEEAERKEAERLRHEAAERAAEERRAEAAEKLRREAAEKEEAEKERKRNEKGKDEDVSAAARVVVAQQPPVAPPVPPVPQKVVVDPEVITFALFGEPGIGKAAVLRKLNASEGYSVIQGKEFPLDAEEFNDDSGVYCLMWDVSRPETLEQLLLFVKKNIDNFKQVPVIFVAGNAEKDPALTPSLLSGDFDDLMVKPESLAKQKERITGFAEQNELGLPVIIETHSNSNAGIAALRKEIVKLAQSFSAKVQNVFQRMKHSRKVRTAHLKEIFEDGPLDDNKIQWLLLHKDSVNRYGQTAALIDNYFREKLNVAPEIFTRIEVNPVVPKLLAFLDEHERWIRPKVVMFFSYKRFDTNDYEGTRQAILDVAERIYKKGNVELKFEDRQDIFSSPEKEAKIPKEVIDMVEKQYPQLQRPVAVNNVTTSP